MGKHLETDASAATDLTKSVARIERWSDGKDYMAMTVASSAFRGLPNFGWRIVLRQELKAALAPTRELARQFWIVLIATTALALIILFLETVWLIQPLRRLVRFGNELTEERLLKFPTKRFGMKKRLNCRPSWAGCNCHYWRQRRANYDRHRPISLTPCDLSHPRIGNQVRCRTKTAARSRLS